MHKKKKKNLLFLLLSGTVWSRPEEGKGSDHRADAEGERAVADDGAVQHPAERAGRHPGRDQRPPPHLRLPDRARTPDEGGRPAVRGVRQLPCAHGNDWFNVRGGVGRGEGLRDEMREAALQSGEFVSCPAHMVTACLMCGRGGVGRGEGLRDEMREAALQSGEFVSCPAHMVTACLMCGRGG